MDREQWLRNAELRGCDAIPCLVYLSAAVRRLYGDELERVCARYPELDVIPSAPFEDDERFAPGERAGEQLVDAWGCVWENLHDGIVGQVTGNPLADWDAMDGYGPPSPAETGHFDPIDWEHEERIIRSGREAGVLTRGAVDHGFFFQRLYYLRGFEGLMEDVGRADPRLDTLCEMVLAFNEGLVRRYLDIGVDVMYFGDDLGMQDRLTISPAAWRRWVKPAYARLFGMCREGGTHVYLHSDGHIVDVMPDLIECGVTILNPQDLCNGLENVRRLLKGKVCIDLDIDRQRIVPRKTPAEIDVHIRRCVETLCSPRGGLMLTCGIYPGTPLRNIESVLSAMSKYRTPDTRRSLK